MSGSRTEGSADEGGMVTDVAAVAAGDLIPRPDRPVPWPPPDWRCRRWRGISGRYSGSSDLTTILRTERLELRLDVDSRYSADSPVMNKVSGDHFTQHLPAVPARLRRRALQPLLDRRQSGGDLGPVQRHDHRRRPLLQRARPRDHGADRGRLGAGGADHRDRRPSAAASPAPIRNDFVSDSFRTLELEMDYCEQRARRLRWRPATGPTSTATSRPTSPTAPLTVDVGLSRGGRGRHYSGGSSVVDDSAAGFATWNVRRAARRDGDGVQPLRLDVAELAHVGPAGRPFDSADARRHHVRRPGRQRRGG